MLAIYLMTAIFILEHKEVLSMRNLIINAEAESQEDAEKIENLLSEQVLDAAIE